MSKGINYGDAISNCIQQLNDKNGSSSAAIVKWLKEKHSDEADEKKIKTQLKKMAKDGQLVQVKNSFKLAVQPAAKDVKPLIKKTGLALKPKKRVNNKKITGAADIIK